MATDHLLIKVGADASGANAVFDHLGKRVKGLSSEIASGLKGAIIGAIGIGSVSVLVKSMLDFAEQIKLASDRLGVTVERVQQLRVAARHLGKDLEFFEILQPKIETFASKALGVGTKESLIAARLGITPAMLSGPKGLDWDNLLQQMLKGAGGLKRQVGEGLLMQAGFNKKTAGDLLGPDALKALSNRNTEGLISAEDVEKLHELKMSFEDIIDVIQQRMIPVFASMVEGVEKFVLKLSSIVAVDKAKEDYAKKVQNDEDRKRLGLPARLINRLYTENALLANELFGGKNKTENRMKLLNNYDEIHFGKGVNESPEVIAAKQKVIMSEAELRARADARRAAYEKNKALGPDGVFREAPTKDVKEFHLEKLETPKGSLLSVGGLAGIDIQYRQERHLRTVIEVLRSIDAKLEPQREALLGGKIGI